MCDIGKAVVVAAALVESDEEVEDYFDLGGPPLVGQQALQRERGESFAVYYARKAVNYWT